MKDNVNIYDVAKEAGVSIATVSRVLNENTKVATATREKVKKVIEQLNFNPSELARSLYRGGSKVIGCILPDITNPYYSYMFLQIEQCALENGYAVVLCNSLNLLKNDVMYLKILVEQRVEGIIYMGRIPEDTNEAKAFDEQLNTYAKRIPVVLLNWTKSRKYCYNILSNRLDGLEQILMYVSKKGYSRIGIIGGEFKDNNGQRIKDSVYEQIFKNYQLSLEDKHIIAGDHSILCGVSNMNEILNLKEIPEVVFCINDNVAIGAIKACLKRNLNIPKDIAITGFDDTPMAEIGCIGITTVAHDYKNMAKKAINVIIDAEKTLENIENHDNVMTSYFPMKLVERESC